MNQRDPKANRRADFLAAIAALLFLTVLAMGAIAQGGTKAHPIRVALASLGLSVTGVAWSGVLWKVRGEPALIGCSSRLASGDLRDAHDPQRLASTIALQLLGGLIFFALFGGLWEWIQFPEANVFDETIVRRFYHRGGPMVTRMMRAISDAGGRDLMVFVVPGLLIGLILFRRCASALFLGSTMLGSFGQEVLFKVLAYRSRPGILTDSHFDSFPSGHALAATILAGSLFVLFAPLCRRPRDRVFFTAAAIAWPLLLGISRVYLGRHYPTDVIAGILLGAGWVCFCRALSGTFAIATLPAAGLAVLQAKGGV